MSDPFLNGSVLYNDDQNVAAYVASQISHMQGRPFQYGPDGKPLFCALGVIRRGVFAGGVVFHNYHGHDIEMSAAFHDPSWCLPQTLRQLFRYPFIQLGCIRMTTITGRKNKRARSSDERMGFKLEGVARRAIDGREDAMIYGMLREECVWIKDKTSG